MSQEHARIRHLKQQWDDEDAVRDGLERQAQRSFLEEQANQLFAPIEDFLTRLDKVLRTVGGSAEIDGIWEHLGDGRLRRIAKVTSTEPRRQLGGSPEGHLWRIGPPRPPEHTTGCRIANELWDDKKSSDGIRRGLKARKVKRKAAS
jgi:hypothetical protein